MQLSVAEVLDRAADLIEPEGAWTQKTLARSALGRPVPAASDKAVCWCASGAILRADPQMRLAVAAWNALLAVIDYEVIPHWNDAPDRTQAEVVAALRAAALKARDTLSVVREEE